MTLHNPSWLQADSYGAVDFRLPLSALINSAGGIVGSGDYQVTAPSSGMSVNVAAGQIWIPGTQVTNQAQYYMLNDGTISVTVPAADSTNPRIDLIVAQVEDSAYGGSSSLGQVVDVAGTPAASPAVPATPANSIVLAHVAVAAGVTSIVSGNITDERIRFGIYNPVPYKARAYLASSGFTLSSPNGIIPLDTVSFDPSKMFSTSTHGFQVPITGYYQIECAIQAAYNNNPQTFQALILDGASITSQGSLITMRGDTSGDPMVSVASDIVYLLATSTVYLYGANNGPNVIAISNGSALTYMSIALLSN